MTEETLFAEAIEKSTPAERAAFLDAACSGDAVLRQRVEALLQSHAREDFLKTPAIQRAAEVAGGSPIVGATEAEVHGHDSESALDFLVPSEKPDSLGRLGHYEVLEVIGRGGMGIVLRAFDEKLHRVVAIKVMAPELAATSPPRKRFLREARSAAAVRHEHVVDIHAVEEQPIPYLVMEYVCGETLQQKHERVGPFEVPEVLRLGQQIARGLAAAHERGLIHRDIKPSNILLEKGAEERVKITDFGLARAVADASLTQSGVIAGTPMYMAPEQTVGDSIDHRADLFSLGSVLYTMCSGRPPFRATTSMATLKRVAEDTPRPIREIIPEVPGWLCDIIAKLQAKKPEDRFQSAKEVADLLGCCLANLEQGKPVVVDQAARLVEQPHAGKSPKAAAPIQAKGQIGGLPPRRAHWGVAAAVLVLVLGGLSLSEATGVSNLRATVIRIFTPEGTLVVEVDDPGVKVTVEGDGGLVITGAGPQEVRLRAGNYRLRATKDGQPVKLDRDLVTITRRDRQIVRVRLEGDAPAAAAPLAERGAFIVLGGKGVAERKFDTLADAVQGASDGDTIEIRGNGPFLTKPINIHRTALTVRAGAGFRPVVKLSPEAVPHKAVMLATQAALVLEGLELHRAPSEDPGSGGDAVVEIYEAPLRAANCRFRGPIWANHSPVCVLRNCEFISTQTNGGFYRPGARVSFDNCLLWTTWGVMGLHYDYGAALDDISLQIGRSTFVSGRESFWLPLRRPLPAGSDGPKASTPIHLAVSGCIFDSASVLSFQQTREFLDKAALLQPAEAEAMLLHLLQWQGERNLFASGSVSVMWTAAWEPQSPHGPKSLKEWKKFWGSTEADSLEGRPRFQGGNLLSRSEADLDQLTPDDFRLRPDSAGYRAGKDGKDLGADVDLVGPGPAYERWKKTPEYQKWLKDTKQGKK
jgi:hypothetical protein